MTKKVAIILSGCGVFDGTEIHEAVITMLSLSRAGAQYRCFAPDIDQHHVVNHLTGVESEVKRRVLVESPRVARGEVFSVSELKANDFDALIIPGGFGAAKNLCNFALAGAEMQINDKVLLAVKSIVTTSKPIGLMCIAPAMAGRLFDSLVSVTIGNDPETAHALA